MFYGCRNKRAYYAAYGFIMLNPGCTFSELGEYLLTSGISEGYYYQYNWEMGHHYSMKLFDEGLVSFDIDRNGIKSVWPN